MITQRELLLAFLLPALLCLLLGMLAARVREGPGRRFAQALAAALPCGLAFRAGPEVVTWLFAPLLLLEAWARAPREILVTLGFFTLLFFRLAAPPAWPEKSAAGLAFGLAWAAAARTPASFPAWRPLLALTTFGGTVACACLCGRSGSLATAAAGLATAVGAAHLASLWRPSWSFGRPGFDLAAFSFAAALACAVYLAELPRAAALALLASLAASRLPSFALACGAQLALAALGLWIAWPADGFDF